MSRFHPFRVTSAAASKRSIGADDTCNRMQRAKDQRPPVAHPAYGGEPATYTDAYAGPPAAAYGQPQAPYGDGGYNGGMYSNQQDVAPPGQFAPYSGGRYVKA